ncbi:MAG: DNA-formamidopyrimidine glycosylase [Firmicutes bacterium]|nr:DNA-formamidopyrimidine glycosylase [Bacillota bacterium]
MPELPEVETVRRSLSPVILNQPIKSLNVYYERILQHVSPAQFRRQLTGSCFINLTRRGKYLIFQLDNDLEMVAHLRMTGRLIYFSDAKIELAKHTSAVFGFESGGELRFEDVRKFGTIDLVPRGKYEQIKGLSTLGVEPLSQEFTVEHLQELTRKRSAKIKGLLLDQTKIAGLGNIYADESLFMAGIHPEREAGSLNLRELKKLHQAIVEVLQEAIVGQGTTLRDYRTGYGREGSFQNKLQIYGKKGEKCPRCGVDLEYKKVAGRTSHFCPACQRE